MTLEYFKDKLFDLLNESDSLDLADLRTDDRNSLFHLRTADGSEFVLTCRRL